MIGNRFYTWFKNYYQWVGGAFNETLLLPLVRATAGLRAGAIRYDETTNTVETYDGTNWNPIPSATGFVPNSRTITINGTTFDLSTNRIYSVGTVTSVGLSMPAAFTVSGSPVTGSGTLSVTGAGLATQYVRGDGTLANFPTTQGGGSSVSYYLNGSVNQGTFGGSTYYEMNRTPVLGAGTNFSRNTDGYIASFITDANDPALTEIPGGNFNLELYFSASSGGGNPSFYVEFYKYDGTTFSLIASNQSSPDTIVGSTKDAYFTALAVPQTTLAITDRLAIRVYVAVAGRTITLHTEDQNLCQVITTFSTGINTINGLTKQVQFLTTGTSGTDFNINSTNSTHTFNIPTASATNRGALSSTDWTTFNNKVSTSRQLTINGTAFDLSADRSWNVGTVTSVGLNTGSAGTDINVSGSPVNVSGNITLNIPTASATNRGALSAADWAIFNAKQNALTLTTTGNSGASTLVGATLNVPEYTLSGLGGVPTTRTLTINGTALDLSANRSWSVGTVTSVGLTSATSGVTISDSPVTVSGTIGIAIATANGSQQGLLSSTDWTTFNNKQNTLSLTTTGTSGAATLVGATLNVPQYQAQGNYITSLTGEATASGPGAASVTLSTTAVTGKLLTGLNLSGGGTIAATDSILQAFGKVQNQISAMVGGVMYQGTWNASTNTPTLTSSVGTKGNYYIVDVSGTTNLNGITDWRVGDWAIFNGSTWDKVDNTDAVSSVNGFTGAVSLTTSHIAEGTNLYYLDSRSRTAISLTTTGNSGAATYDNVSGIINVPQYTLAGLGGVPSTRQLTINGTAFDLSADRSWSVGTVTSVGLNSTTSGVTITNTPVTSSGALTINIATASGSQQGLLSSTDWTTFNNKQNALTNPVTGAGMTTQLAYFNGTTTITSASLFYDVANVRLGINKSTPSVTLDVSGTAAISLDLTARTLIAEGTGSYNAGLVLKQYSSANFYGAGYTQLYAVNTTNLQIVYNQASSQRRAELSAALLNDGDNFQYLFPRSNGTLALTSNINSAVSGTTNFIPKFTSANAIGNSQIFDNGTQLGFGVSNLFSSFTFGTTNNRYEIADVNTNTLGLEVLNNARSLSNNLSFYSRGTSFFTRSGGSGSYVQSLILNDSGNLGLGVTPSAWGAGFTALQVRNASFWSTGSDASITANAFYDGSVYRYIASTAASRFYHNTDGSFIWSQAPSGTAGNAISFTQAMTLDASGRLGIGTTTPANRLHVSVASSGVSPRTDLGGTIIAEGSTRAGLYILTSGTDAGSYGSIWFGNGNTNTDAFITVNNSTRAMAFGTADGTRMTITSGGNVGIGTSSPGNQLTVYRTSSSTSNGALLLDGNGNYAGVQFAGSGTIYGSLSVDNVAMYMTHGNSISFRTGSSANVGGTDRVTITSGGNVGIGTTTPENASGYATMTINGSSGGQITFATTNSKKGYLYNNATNMYIGAESGALIFDAGAIERMRITSGGNVLIGTQTDTGQILQVNGKTRSTEYISNSGSVSIAAGATATILNLATAQGNGSYTIGCYVGGGGLIYFAQAVFISNWDSGSYIKALDIYDGANVTLSISGSNVQITNNGFSTFTWNWSSLYQPFN